MKFLKYLLYSGFMQESLLENKNFMGEKHLKSIFNEGNSLLKIFNFESGYNKEIQAKALRTYWQVYLNSDESYNYPYWNIFKVYESPIFSLNDSKDPNKKGEKIRESLKGNCIMVINDIISDPNDEKINTLTLETLKLWRDLIQIDKLCNLENDQEFIQKIFDFWITILLIFNRIQDDYTRKQKKFSHDNPLSESFPLQSPAEKFMYFINNFYFGMINDIEHNLKHISKRALASSIQLENEIIESYCKNIFSILHSLIDFKEK